MAATWKRRYPPGQEVHGENQIFIAAAFKPGTK
jgi:hypothetical protein